MRVILEGPDNSGKTTLSQRLRSMCRDLPYFLAGNPPTNRDEELRCMIDQQSFLHKNSNCVLDRVTCISQQVYNPDDLLTATRNQFVQTLLEMDSVFVYCRPSTDRLMRVEDYTWRDDESEEHKQKIIENAHLFIQRYDALFCGVSHVSYDFEDREAADILISKLANSMYSHQASIDFVKKLVTRSM